jgi:magnesium transporter
MIRILSWTPSGDLQTDLPLSDCKDMLASPDNRLWVDIFNAEKEDSTYVLKDIFEFHPLAIEDSLEETHVPKIDDWGSYLYLVLQLISPDSQFNEEISTDELDLFIGKNFLVTYHISKSTTIDKIWEKLVKNHTQMNPNPAQILYLLLDEIASEFITHTDLLDFRLNDLEDQLFDNPDPSLLEVIFSLKRGILQLRHGIGPQREVINKLTRGDYPILGKESLVYYRDVYDHFLRLFDIIENLRDLTSNTLEIFLSVVNNRMNGIMKTLTVITTLFMPISFLAGFFGMNFFKPVVDLGEWTSHPAFYIVLAASILFPVGMLLYFNRKGWMR